jgi:hypothetical protein
MTTDNDKFLSITPLESPAAKKHLGDYSLIRPQTTGEETLNVRVMKLKPMPPLVEKELKEMVAAACKHIMKRHGVDATWTIPAIKVHMHTILADWRDRREFDRMADSCFDRQEFLELCGLWLAQVDRYRAMEGTIRPGK